MNDTQMQKDNKEYHELLKKLGTLEQELATAENAAQEAQAECDRLRYELNEVMTSRCWRITGFYRVIADGVRNLFAEISIITGENLLRIKRKIPRRVLESGLRKKICFATFSERDLEKQRVTPFQMHIKFSILVPLYNTPKHFLKDMIQSVQKQTYADWELCLADGSDKGHNYIRAYCEKAAKTDQRIRYRRLEKNLGISGNTNACMDLAGGNWFALLDQDDVLHPAALYEVAKVIESQGADFVYTDEAVFRSPNLHSIRVLHLKPDYSPFSLRGNNYICHFTAFSAELLQKTGTFRSEYDGSQDHDLFLRLTGLAQNVVHVPKVLYFWRSHPNSTAANNSSKNYAAEAGCRAVKAFLAEQGIKADVETCGNRTVYRVRYALTSQPKVSILIPTKDHLTDIHRCVESILEKTTYPNYEIILIDNGSGEESIKEYYRDLKKRGVEILYLDIPFNYPKLNNFGAEHAAGEYLLLLNNDTEVITPGWIEEMLMFAQRSDVGIVGAKLYYPDDTVQHAGVIIGLGGTAGHHYSRAPRSEQGYLYRLIYAQELSAVTGACMMVSASVFRELGGLDEDFEVALNDIDFCMRVRQAGYRVIWTPFAELYHMESRSRGYDEDDEEKMKRLIEERIRFGQRWKTELEAGDPFYHPNLSMTDSDFSLKES